jgi:virginiamycin B lyase
LNIATLSKTPLSLIEGASGSLLCQWTGAGGDSLAIGFGAIWLTDFDSGVISRIAVRDTLARCTGSSVHRGE